MGFAGAETDAPKRSRRPATICPIGRRPPMRDGALPPRIGSSTMAATTRPQEDSNMSAPSERPADRMRNTLQILETAEEKAKAER